MSEVARGRRRGAGWTSVGYGLHVLSEDRTVVEVDLVDRLRAWRLVLPEASVFTSLTAAALRGWWLPAMSRPLVQVAVGERDSHPQRRGLQVLRLKDTPERELVQGLPVATAAETVLAAASELAVLDLVPLADSALRSGGCSLEELTALAATRRRGSPRLRAVLNLLDPRSESAWESIMRVLHRAAGVDVEPQHEIFDGDGRFVARADLWLVGTRRIHEYDGEGHLDKATHRQDLDRDRRLVETGWQSHGYTAADVLYGGGPILASVDALLGRGWDPERLARWRMLVAESSYGRRNR